MSDTCSTCFFGQGKFGDKRLCRVHSPLVVLPNGIAWPVVRDIDWCGQGIDKDTYNSFTPKVTPA